MNNLISSHIENSVLYIQLDRLNKKNALTSAMYDELRLLFNQADVQGDIHAVAIHGDANCFTAGNDLNDFLNHSSDEELAAVKFVKTLVAFKKPLLAAVAGPAVGIGTTILLHCDYVVAAPNSFFKLPFTQLGLCPEAASSLLLPRLIGHNKAFELLVMGEAFNEQDAKHFGIINQVVSTEELLDHLREKSSYIAQLPVNSVMASKALMKSSIQPLIDNSTAEELEQFLTLLNGEESQQIIQQLLKK